LECKDVFVGCSIGIAFYPKDGMDADILMRNADLGFVPCKR